MFYYLVGILKIISISEYTYQAIIDRAIFVLKKRTCAALENERLFGLVDGKFTFVLCIMQKKNFKSEVKLAHF